jgi:hypothetical protein
MVEAIVGNETVWEAAVIFCETILSYKVIAERERERERGRRMLKPFLYGAGRSSKENVCASVFFSPGVWLTCDE